MRLKISSTSDWVSSMRSGCLWWSKKQNHFTRRRYSHRHVIMARKTSPIEDEIGDVLEKAIRQRQWTTVDLATATGICQERLQDVLDYRSDLSRREVLKIAEVLDLNEVGLCALNSGHYPLPTPVELPFALHVVPMCHGVGQVNAYVVTHGADAGKGLLFDTGPNVGALLAAWPATVAAIEAVFLTHVEGEHTGGLCDVVDYFGIKTARIPAAATAPCGSAMPEGETYEWQGLVVSALATPGHAAAHSCYLVRTTKPQDTALLIAGDLIFAGSAGGAFYDAHLQQAHLKRILALCREDTVIAPGHGPLTTVRNERLFNPFSV